MNNVLVVNTKQPHLTQEVHINNVSTFLWNKVLTDFIILVTKDDKVHTIHPTKNDNLYDIQTQVKAYDTLTTFDQSVQDDKFKVPVLPDVDIDKWIDELPVDDITNDNIYITDL